MLCSKVRTIKKPYPSTNKNLLNKLYKIQEKKLQQRKCKERSLFTKVRTIKKPYPTLFI